VAPSNKEDDGTSKILKYKLKAEKFYLNATLPVACPWSVVLSRYSGFFHH
jgi:hypothetical protein